MVSSEKKQYGTIFKYIIALIYISSAVLKLIDFEATVLIIQSIVHIDIMLLKTALFVLILTEVSIAVTLLLNYLKLLAKYVLIFLSIIFIVFNLVLIFKGIDNCGCFGASIKQSPYISLIKNIAIIIMIYKI